MIEVYLTSEKESDIELFNRFSTIGYVTMSFRLNEEPVAPELVDTVMHEGSRCKIARFPKFSGDTKIEMSVNVMNDEVPLPTVSGYSEATASVIFAFGTTDNPSLKWTECDWKDAEALIPVGA